MSETPIISFKDFTFQYDAQKKPTLKNINLDVYPGEKILICGASGSGKTYIACALGNAACRKFKTVRLLGNEIGRTILQLNDPIPFCER